MIRFRDTILEDFFIDPVTAVITNSKGEIQETTILNGRSYFKGHKVYEWQMHTYLGWKNGLVIHHIDENKLNNSLENLVYLTHSEHMKLHNKGKNNPFYGKHHSNETLRKMRENLKGENNGMFKKHHSEETKNKIRDSSKDRIWINNGVVNKLVKINSDIPEGFVKGMLKRKINRDFVKLCYTEFKKNDPKFPQDWRWKDYKKYIDECNRILEKENEEKTF